MDLEELKVYKLAMELGEKVWNIVDRWSYFQKDTIGKQLARAADSVAPNLSEGYGRYHFKESKNFAYYSRGSLYETKTWLTKANNRNFISPEEFSALLTPWLQIVKMLNNYIKSIGPINSGDTANDPTVVYGYNEDGGSPFTDESFNDH